jgi:hypothetical protein
MKRRRKRGEEREEEKERRGKRERKEGRGKRKEERGKRKKMRLAKVEVDEESGSEERRTQSSPYPPSARA